MELPKILQKSTNFAPEQEPQKVVLKVEVGMLICTFKDNQQKWAARCEQWDGPKVCCKFKDSHL